MRYGAVLLIALCGATVSQAEQIDVPSGQPVTLHEVLSDAPGLGLAYRFRFIAPRIADGMDYRVAEFDMAYLCRTYALPRVPNVGPRPSQIVISLSDRPVPFGQADVEAVQFFEAYRPEDGTCVWEMH